jgi:hypothetical protein
MAQKYLIKGKPKINKYSRGDMKLVTSVDPAPNEIIEKNLQELEETEELDKPSFNTRSIKKKAPPPPPKRTPSQEKELLKKKDAPKRKKTKQLADAEYVIDEITDDRTVRKKKEYKIKYESFPAEWQTLANMKKDIDKQLLKLLIDNYKLKKKIGR